MQNDNVKYIKELFDSGNLSIILGETKESYFLYTNNSYIKLNKNFYELLKIIKESNNINTLKQINNYENFNKLCENIKNIKQKDSYIYFKLEIINKQTVSKISKYFEFLFNKKLFIPFFLLIILFNTIFYVYHFKINDFNLMFSDLIIYYIILIFIMIMHELGHSTACKYFGIKPNNIGFGFYAIFPVLYANVTNTWLLSKEKRIVVNIGGIYFQLIINLILIFINFFYNENLLTKIINVNFFVACYSLIPFLKNDGYWIYSDLFNIPNLSSESKFYYLKIINQIFENKSLKISYPLFLYSIGNTFFLFFIIYTYSKYLFINILDITSNNDIVTIIQKCIFILIISLFFILFLRKHTISIYNLLKKLLWKLNTNFRI